MDRSLLISKVKGMEQNMAPETDSSTVLDINNFPELKGKKEGDTVSITFKVDQVKGREVHLSPAGMDETQDKSMQPSAEGYRQEPGEQAPAGTQEPNQGGI